MTPRSLWGDAGRRLRRNRAAVAAAGVLAVLAALVIVVPWLSPHAYDYTDWTRVGVAPTLSQCWMRSVTRVTRWLSSASIGS